MAHSEFKRGMSEEKQKRSYYEMLLNGIKSTTESPESYAQYLNFASEFPKRSVSNQMLIYLQKPDAHLVAKHEDMEQVWKTNHKRFCAN